MTLLSRQLAFGVLSAADAWLSRRQSRIPVLGSTHRIKHAMNGQRENGQRKLSVREFEPCLTRLRARVQVVSNVMGPADCTSNVEGLADCNSKTVVNYG